MKKIFLILLITIISIASVFAVVTDEEFDEVYNQLEVSTNALIAQQETISELTTQIDKLVSNNKSLTESLKTSSEEIKTLNSLLNESKTNLDKSSSSIRSLLNKKLIAEAKIGVSFVDTKPYIGAGIGFGYKVFTFGYLKANFFMNTRRDFDVSLSYDIVF